MDALRPFCPDLYPILTCKCMCKIYAFQYIHTSILCALSVPIYIQSWIINTCAINLHANTYIYVGIEICSRVHTLINSWILCSLSASIYVQSWIIKICAIYIYICKCIHICGYQYWKRIHTLIQTCMLCALSVPIYIQSWIINTCAKYLHFNTYIHGYSAPCPSSSISNPE